MMDSTIPNNQLRGTDAMAQHDAGNSPLWRALIVLGHDAISDVLTVIGADAADFPCSEMQMLTLEQGDDGLPEADGSFRVPVLLGWIWDPENEETAEERAAMATGTFRDGVAELSSVELDLDRCALPLAA